MVSTNPCGREPDKESSNFCRSGLLPARLGQVGVVKDNGEVAGLVATDARGSQDLWEAWWKGCSPMLLCSSNKRRGSRAACVLVDMGDALSAVVELFGSDADRDGEQKLWTL